MTGSSIMAKLRPPICTSLSAAMPSMRLCPRRTSRSSLRVPHAGRLTSSPTTGLQTCTSRPAMERTSGFRRDRIGASTASKPPSGDATETNMALTLILQASFWRPVHDADIWRRDCLLYLRRCQLGDRLPACEPCPLCKWIGRCSNPIPPRGSECSWAMSCAASRSTRCRAASAATMAPTLAGTTWRHARIRGWTLRDSHLSHARESAQTSYTRRKQYPGVSNPLDSSLMMRLAAGTARIWIARIIKTILHTLPLVPRTSSQRAPARPAIL